MTTQRLTMAQALITYLSRQHVSRDGVENPFFAGMWGIFGHGNVAGLGQALEQYAPDFRYYQSRNEQAQVLALSLMPSTRTAWRPSPAPRPSDRALPI